MKEFKTTIYADTIEGKLGLGVDYYKGEPGKSGADEVYIGAEPPTDPQVKLWVDTEAQSVGAVDWNDVENKPNFATVAESGSYNDLTDKPTIPEAPDLSNYATKDDLANAKPDLTPYAKTADLSTVATSGSYEDLTNKPTIPDAYTLPIASTTTLGGVKVDGTTITIADGVISSAGGGGSVSVDGTSIIQNEDGTISTAIGGSKTMVTPETVLSSYEDEVGVTRQSKGSSLYRIDALNTSSLDKTLSYIIKIEYRNANTGETGSGQSVMYYQNAIWQIDNLYVFDDKIKTVNEYTTNGLKGTSHIFLPSGDPYQIYYITKVEILKPTTYAYNPINANYIPISDGLAINKDGKLINSLSSCFIPMTGMSSAYTPNASNSINDTSNYSLLFGSNSSIESTSYGINLGRHNDIYRCSNMAVAIGEFNSLNNAIRTFGFGSRNTINADLTFVFGYYCVASSENQMVLGRYNIEDSASQYPFIIGNGTSTESRNNGLTIDTTGNLAIAGTISSAGADYAEFFEWKDGNPEAEDRVGYIVSLDGNKLTLANEGDYILGVVSGTATVLGDNPEWNWAKRWVTDDFGRIQYEDKVIHHEAEDDIPAYDETIKAPIVNPDYNPDQKYIKRADRPEWSAVGMMGKLYVRDDGTCQVNGFAKPINGVATASTSGTMRVIERVSDNVIRVVIK